MPSAGSSGYGKPPVSDEHPIARRDPIVLGCGFLAVCIAVVGLGMQRLEVPGLNYDEVIQAEPARQFLRVNGRPSEIPGIESGRWLGRWFPLMTQPYMGALKSQSLIPIFAAFGATATSLRLTTLAWGLLGLLLAMLWARRVLGLPAALLAGALLAFDPSFFFVSRHDWGSVTLALICRCGGLYFGFSGWTGRSGTRLFIAGLLLGLGLYNKIDFGIFLAAAGVGLGLAASAATRRALISPRRGLPIVLGFALGATPMAIALNGAVRASRAVMQRRGGAATDWSEKLHALETTLDGSYFHRLILSGGSFEEMFDVEGAASGPFLWIFLASVVFLAVRCGTQWRRDPVENDARAVLFVLVTTVLSLAGMLLMPGAERIHHVLNAYPFPHFTVAIAVIELWRMGGLGGPGGERARLAHASRTGALLRGTAVVVAAIALTGGLWVSLRTLDTIRETGGRGRWSDALTRFAIDLESRPRAVVVSLDWGLDGPIRFTAPDHRFIEPIWKLQKAHRRAEDWRHDGTAQHEYLLYEKPFALFDFGASFQDAIRSLPPGSVTIERHLDRRGDPVFLSVRFRGPHRLIYRRGFEIHLR